MGVDITHISCAAIIIRTLWSSCWERVGNLNKNHNPLPVKKTFIKSQQCCLYFFICLFLYSKSENCPQFFRILIMIFKSTPSKNRKRHILISECLIQSRPVRTQNGIHKTHKTRIPKTQNHFLVLLSREKQDKWGGIGRKTGLQFSSSEIWILIWILLFRFRL